MAQTYDDELAALQHEFDEIAVAHFKQCHAAAVSEAILQRAMDPDMLIH
jgi:hypothetical protein